MPINVFGNSSNFSGKKIDTTLLVQKPYLRSNYIVSNIEEHIDLKNQYRVKSLPDPIRIREACSKNYFAILFNDPCITKNTEHIDLIDRNNTNARFIQVNQLPQMDSHLTAKMYDDNSVDESSLLRLDPNEKLKLDEQDSIIANSTLTKPKTIIRITTKAYIDSLHDKNEQSRRDLGLDFYNESNNLVKCNQDNDPNDNKLTNLDCITINRNPVLNDEVSNEKYVDDELKKNTKVKFN